MEFTMGERISDTRTESGMNRGTLRLWGLILVALGLFSSCVLRTKVLGMGQEGNDLMAVLGMEGGMSAGTVALGFEAVGYCAVPVFAVLTLDGFQRTKSVRLYLLRLLGTACLSEIPYNLAHSGKLLDLSDRNPVFGTVLCVAALYLFRYYGGLSFKNVLIKTLVGFAALLWASMFKVEQGVPMLIIVMVLWAFRERHTLRFFLAGAAAICCSVGKPLFMFAPFGFLLAHAYNGKEGVPMGKVHYFLYPLLLVLIAAVGYLLF